jgi:hypothetical protein
MDGPSQLGLVSGFYCFSIRWPNERHVRMRLPPRRKQDWPTPRDKTSNGFPGLCYRAIGNVYRTSNGFVILQRTNMALAVAACETTPVRVDCSALHRVPLCHVGGFS